MFRRFFFIIIVVLVIILPANSYAQEGAITDFGIGLSNYYYINEPVTPGDIIVRKNNSYMRSFEEYQSDLIGIVVENPAIAINPQVENTYPVLATGNIVVKVNNSNGNIKRGDYITTSKSKGVGMKMTQEGYAIGVARQDVTEFDQNGDAKVLVELDPVKSEIKKLEEKPRMLFQANYPRVSEATGTFKVVKYFISGFILVITLFFLAVNVKRISQEGIKALGRNPLASRPIVLNIFLNLLITLGIGIAGFALSYLLLVI